jgi:hypothetical protein
VGDAERSLELDERQGAAEPAARRGREDEVRVAGVAAVEHRIDLGRGGDQERPSTEWMGG